MKDALVDWDDPDDADGNTAHIAEHGLTPEERRIREMHRQNPIREVPADAMSGEDASNVLAMVAAIRREREAQRLSIQQLAEKSGVDAGVLSRLEAGQSFNPTVATLCRIVRALGHNLHLSFNGETPHGS